MFNVIRNFILGAALLPALVSVMFLYGPYFMNVNPLTGAESQVSEVIQEGYVITQKDIQGIEKLEMVFSELAMFGLLTGCFLALIEVALIVKRKIKQKEYS